MADYAFGSNPPLRRGGDLTHVPFGSTFPLHDQEFADKRTAEIFAGYAVRELPAQIQMRDRAKLLAIDAAAQLDDLRAPPGNRLETLRGDRQGQPSIRINDQWRLCFVWRNAKLGTSRWLTIIRNKIMSIKREDMDQLTVDFSAVRSGRRLPPVHPGEILRDDLLTPMGISVYELAHAIKVPRSRANESCAVAAPSQPTRRFVSGGISA
jgi:proteic killer suppression protein